MRGITIAMLAALTAGGCATEGKIINGNPSAVTIRHDGSYEKSTNLAVKHCEQYGKDARLIHTEGWIMSFDCVERQ